MDIDGLGEAGNPLGIDFRISHYDDSGTGLAWIGLVVFTSCHLCHEIAVQVIDCGL